MTVSVDPSSVPLLEDVGPERFLEWTRGADLCFPNLEEGALLAGTEDPDRIAEGLLGHYPAVVLKLGAEGALYADARGDGRACRRRRRGWWTPRGPGTPCARVSSPRGSPGPRPKRRCGGASGSPRRPSGGWVPARASDLTLNGRVMMVP